MQRRRAGIVAITFIAMAGSACAAPGRGGDGPTPASTPPGATAATLDGVVLTVVIEPNPLDRATAPTAFATLRNDRNTPVQWTSGGCAFGNLEVTVPTPWEPTGRSWAGREGWFKAYLLENAYGPGGVAASSPVSATLLSTPCEGPLSGQPLLPGKTLRADFSRGLANFIRTYTYVSGVPFSITVELDPQNTPPPPPEPGQLPQHFFIEYRHVTASGELSINGSPTTVLTAGQAIDALLEVDRFTTWLEAQQPGTCETSNLFLAGGQDVVDAATWFIDLYCETGVPRHWFAAQVDAVTGDVTRLRFCEDECD